MGKKLTRLTKGQTGKQTDGQTSAKQTKMQIMHGLELDI